MTTKRKLQQIKTGVHLVKITNATLIDEILRIRFTKDQILHFDQDYWLTGDSTHFFYKMCASANIDPNAKRFKSEAIDKMLWICIKEVHDIDGDKPVTDEAGLPSINYFLFDTLPCLDPSRKPIVKGDPDANEGNAQGVFLDYKQVTYSNRSEIMQEYPATGGPIGHYEIVDNKAIVILDKSPSDEWDNL